LVVAWLGHARAAAQLVGQNRDRRYCNIAGHLLFFGLTHVARIAKVVTEPYKLSFPPLHSPQQEHISAPAPSTKWDPFMAAFAFVSFFPGSAIPSATHLHARP